MTGDDVYGYPVLQRAGLGNMLFSWARCVTWCRTNDQPMIAPRWRKIRIGPYLRGEREKRRYHECFTNPGDVGGLRRLALLALGRRVPETALPLEDADGPRPTVVVFEEMRDCYEPLIGHHALIRDEIERMTEPRFLPEDSEDDPYIGVHVRRGDFLEPDDPQVLKQGAHNYRLPVEWYVSAVQNLREEMSFQAPVRVFTDGSREQVSDLLDLPETTISRGARAITDLLSLSRSRVMIGSGSSFSMWASFLGQVPSVWFPGQRLQRFFAEPVRDVLDPEWEPGDALPETFVEFALDRWKDPDVVAHDLLEAEGEDDDTTG